MADSDDERGAADRPVLDADLFVARTAPFMDGGWARPASHVMDADSDSDAETLASAAAPVAGLAPAPYAETLRACPEFDASMLGAGVEAFVPSFPPDAMVGGTAWARCDRVRGVGGHCAFVPVRALCVNLESDFFQPGATRFRQWQTPERAQHARAVAMAAQVSLLFAGTTMGFECGLHAERTRQDRNGADDEEGARQKRKAPERVDRYMFVDGRTSRDAPMFLIGLEELWNRDRTSVVGLRVWKFVFDRHHSDSSLVQRVIRTNRSNVANAGISRATAAQRNDRVAREARQLRLACESDDMPRLEHTAGLQYARVNSAFDLLQLIAISGGARHAASAGCALAGVTLPADLLMEEVAADRSGAGLGGASVTSPEFVYCARTSRALRAGLGADTLGAVCEAQLDPASYWPANAERLGTFALAAPLRGEACSFFLHTQPGDNSPFDLALPRPLSTDVTVGPELLRMFEELEYVGRPVPPQATVRRDFASRTCDMDDALRAMLNNIAEGLSSYDSMHMDADDRRTLDKCRATGMRHGVDESGQSLIEPRQRLHEIDDQCNRIHSAVVERWVATRRRAMDAHAERLVASRGAASRHAALGEALEAMRAEEDEVRRRHAAAMREVAHLALELTGRAFRMPDEAQAIPPGYRDMYKGLEAELARMPHGSANVAHCFDVSATDSQRTTFGNLIEWLYAFFQNDLFIEGRDWQLRMRLFLHIFEPYGRSTRLFVLFGSKGDGKSYMCSQMMRALVPGWMEETGPCSRKAGAQGHLEDLDGRAAFYDEPPNDLLAHESTEALEKKKRQITARGYVSNKVITVRKAGGLEAHRTFRLKTPCSSSFAMCTNTGPNYTSGKARPTPPKEALLDRSVVAFVRKCAARAHQPGDAERHLSSGDGEQRLRSFRILTCLTALVWLVVRRKPYLQPDMALSKRLWNCWDYESEESLARAYSLPKPQPRHTEKRTDDAITLTILNAVAEVFFFKQTACEFPSGALDADGAPKPFHITMLWDVLQTLMPTQEIAHFSWTKALEDSYCTSTLGTATMSLVADLFHFRAADLFCRPAGDDFARYVQTGAALAAIDEALGANAEEPGEADDAGGWRAAEGRAAASAARAADIARRALAHDFAPSFYDFRRILQHAGDALGAAEADALRRQLTARRRARSQFRERCRAELVLGDAERVVDAVFGEAPGADAGGEMGARCSALFPSLLEAALFHRGQSLVQWAEGQCAVVDVGANPLLGTRAHLNYSTWQSRDGNARCYDTAWIELRDPERKRLTTFDAVAEHLVNCGADHYRFFGLHSEAISDSLWLLTRKDNWRRLPMQPTKYDAHWRPAAAMVAPGGEPLSAPRNLIRPAPIDVPRTGCVLVPPAHADDARGRTARPTIAEARKRHCAAHVPDTALQRRVDALLVHGRLPALNPLISSNIALAAPIRFQSDVLQANVGALVDHISLLAESSLRCATTPGLRNMQEAFAAGTDGPVGMAAPERGVGDDALDAALAGDAPTAAADADANAHHTLPYSWDMVQIAMALETVERFYDDTYDQRLQGTLAYLRERGVDVDAHEARFAFDAAPHTTLLFPGYSEDRGRRQTLSARSAHARPDDQRAHIVRDDDENMRTVTRDTVSKAIGRNATHADRRRFVAQERGDLSIRGIEGDVHAQSTWDEHARVSLEERGLICDVGDGDEWCHPYEVLFHRRACLRQRELELLADTRRNGGAPPRADDEDDADLDAMLRAWNLQLAEPRTYEATESRPVHDAEEDAEDAAQDAAHLLRAELRRAPTTLSAIHERRRNAKRARAQPDANADARR